MNDNAHDREYLLRTAQALKAYFEKKLSRDPLSSEHAASVRSAIDGLIACVSEVDMSAQGRQQLEHRLSSMSHETPSNVISIHRTSAPRGFASVTDKRWMLRQDCLIESAYPSDIHKMASELHAHSQRYAFIEFFNIDKTERCSLPGLLSLGAISVYVPCIVELTPTEQSVLLELSKIDSLERPLLMVGTLKPYSELLIEPGLNGELLAHLAGTYLKLTKPFSEYKQQGLIHYFLDSLSLRPS